jgi:hypothetical protein
MSKNEIFELYGKVLKGDIPSKKTFIDLYKSAYPNNWWFYNEPNKENLHIMYLHLYN